MKYVPSVGTKELLKFFPVKLLEINAYRFFSFYSLDLAIVLALTFYLSRLLQTSNQYFVFYSVLLSYSSLSKILKDLSEIKPILPTEFQRKF